MSATELDDQPQQHDSTDATTSSEPPQDNELMRLARIGDLRGIQTLFGSGQYNARSTDVDGSTALHHAAVFNQYAVCHFLIQSGADVNAKGGLAGGPPLLWAQMHNTIGIIRLLLDHGADPLTMDSQGASPMHHAALDGRTMVLLLYLTLPDVPIDTPDSQGCTSLMRACGNGHATCVDVLLQYGANPSAKDESGLTPLNWALAAQKMAVPCMQKLILHGADRFTVSNDGQSIAAAARSMDLSTRWHQALALSGYEHSAKPISFPIPLVSDPRTFLYCFYLVWPFVIIGLVVYVASSLPIYLGLPAGLALSFGMQFSGQRLLRWAPSGMKHIRKTPFLAGVFLGTLAWVGLVWAMRIFRHTFSPYPLTNLFFAVFFSLAGYFHFMTMTSNPGHVPKMDDREEIKQTIYELIDNAVYDERHFCVACSARRPLRSKHCKLCNKCIARQDHHCPWVDNCIGVNNHMHFLLFLLCLMSGIVMLVRLLLAYIEALPRPAHHQCTLLGEFLCAEYSKDPFAILICCWGIVQISWTTMLIIVQLTQIARALTTYESMRGLNMGPIVTALATGSTSSAGAQINAAGGAGPDAVDDHTAHAHPHARKRDGSCWATWKKLLGVDTFIATARYNDSRAHRAPPNPFSGGVFRNCQDFWCVEGRSIQGLLWRKENGLGLLHGQEVDYTHLYELPRPEAGVRYRGGYRSVPGEEGDRTGQDTVMADSV